MISLKRQGKIVCSNELYAKAYDSIKIIFSRFRVTHIEYRHWEADTWHLFGICEDFDEVSIEAESYPLYDYIITDNNKFEFNRV